jgi:hypothetical protein
VTALLVPLQACSITDIDVVEVEHTLTTWVREGKTTGAWSDATTLFIANKMINFVNFSYLSSIRGIHVTGALLGMEKQYTMRSLIVGSERAHDGDEVFS